MRRCFSQALQIQIARYLRGLDENYEYNARPNRRTAAYLTMPRRERRSAGSGTSLAAFRPRVLGVERATRIELAFSAWEAFRARRGWMAPDEMGWSRLWRGQLRTAVDGVECPMNAPCQVRTATDPAGSKEPPRPTIYRRGRTSFRPGVMKRRSLGWFTRTRCQIPCGTTKASPGSSVTTSGSLSSWSKETLTEPATR